jgi:3-dehydroquinate synthetase
MELFKELDTFKEGEFFAIIDQRVKNHVPQWMQFSTKIYWLSNPEEQKNIEDYQRALAFLLKQGIHRKSKLHAIGGGATTDFAGFVAATILRGIPWVAIPTTLLGMIDAAIGGKVGLNMPQGKNLLGSFHSPEHIYICTEFLNTLPEKEWLSGKGELLKYAFLSKDIYQLVMKKAPMEEIVRACAAFKSQVVENDFKEKGDRILLNLGHSLGHAFEHELKIPHGQAVGMGMKYLFTVMEQDQALSEWKKLCEKLELSPELFEIKNFPEFKLSQFLSFLEHDKKKVESKLRLVLVRDIGTCYTEEVPMKDIKSKLQGFHEFNS